MNSRQLERPGRILQVGLDVQQLEDLLERRHPGLIGRVQLGQLLDRVEQVRQRRHKGNHGACRDLAFDRLVSAVQDDPRDRHAREHFHRREVGRVEPHRGHVRVAVLPVELAEARLVEGLGAERAHDTNAGERLLQVGRDRPDRLAGAAEGAGRGQAEPQ